MEHCKRFLPLFCIGFLLAFPGRVFGQMFSVKEKETNPYSVPGAGIYLGFEPADFHYTGTATLAGDGQYAFNDPILRFRLESAGLNLFVGTGGRLTGMNDMSYFDAGVRVHYGLGIIRKKTVTLQIPIQLESNVTSVSNSQTFGNRTQFQQGAVVAGAGLYLQGRPAEKFRLQANFIPSYGYSFATGGTFGGNISQLEGQFRVFLDHLFGEVGLTFGYDYTFRGYEIDGSQFDYNFRSNSILMGITF